MKLIDLNPKWLKHHNHVSWFRVQSKDQADGIQFLCPKCFKANNGPEGTHSIICWAPQVSSNLSPRPGRWTMEGTDFNNLTLKAKSSSVQLTGGCEAHFHIINGEIKDA